MAKASAQGRRRASLVHKRDYSNDRNDDAGNPCEASQVERAARHIEAGDVPHVELRHGRLPSWCSGSFDMFPHRALRRQSPGPGSGRRDPLHRPSLGNGWNFTWMLTAGIAIAVGGRIHLEMSYRYTDAGAIRTDAGDIAILRYREGGARREIPVRINETSANYRPHLLFAALWFEFRLLGGCETVLRRHAPPARVPALKNSTFDLMTGPCSSLGSPQAGAILNPPTRPMDREIRRAIATPRETQHGNYLGFAAGSQGREARRGVSGRDGTEQGTSEAFARPAPLRRHAAMRCQPCLGKFRCSTVAFPRNSNLLPHRSRPLA